MVKNCAEDNNKDKCKQKCEQWIEKRKLYIPTKWIGKTWTLALLYCDSLIELNEKKRDDALF